MWAFASPPRAAKALLWIHILNQVGAYAIAFLAVLAGPDLGDRPGDLRGRGADLLMTLYGSAQCCSSKMLTWLISRVRL
ncbi:hypothetical protein FHR32_007251 [Streptosporangium album]|uniref:Uncharacterized protein n=1 Tax=Streptosporangium album TaxID=47479 RepID=A0A7W7S4M0_9ACTN|nr:hypothetical protein [Streptosporangium album]MBB4942851.1 hypothetical protein [Streptosporangium album]